MTVEEQSVPPLSSWMRKTETRTETVAHVAEVAACTVRRARKGLPLTLRTAEAISRATGGDVSVMALLRGSEPK